MAAESIDSWWGWLLLLLEAVEAFAIALPAFGLMLAAVLLIFPRLWKIRIRIPGIPRLAKHHKNNRSHDRRPGSAQTECTPQDRAVLPV